MQGNTKKTPGPRAPPDLFPCHGYFQRKRKFVRFGFSTKFVLQMVIYLKRPIRKMTARSYSDTILKQRKSENGNVSITNRPENSVENISMHPDRVPSAETKTSDICVDDRPNVTNFIDEVKLETKTENIFVFSSQPQSIMGTRTLTHISIKI